MQQIIVSVQLNLKMEATIISLISTLYSSKKPGSRLMIGICGPPGSGKSTIANAVQNHFKHNCVVVPMDGFHLYKRELDLMKDPIEAHRRRGAPFTFNSSRFVENLVKIQEGVDDVVKVPSFDHSVGDPIEEAIHVYRHHDIILVEGLYLLLHDSPWCALSDSILNAVYYLDVGLEVALKRCALRNSVAMKISLQEANIRVDVNDRNNGILVETTKSRSSKVILEKR